MSKRTLKFCAPTCCLALVLLVFQGYANGVPTVFPKGVTINNTEKTYKGYTLFFADKKAVALDMDGNEYHSWLLPNASSTIVKPLSNGRVAALIGADSNANSIAVYDWDGNVTWKYTNNFFDGFHHDFQRLSNGNTLLLVRKWRNVPKIVPCDFMDDIIIEVDPDGHLLWRWSTAEHFLQLGLSAAAKDFIYSRKVTDVFHTNSVQSLPTNWLSATDPRFKPGNILVSQRQTGLVFIIDKESRKVVWKLDRKLGALGQHHARMIPNNLSGAGHILIFDNGGYALYPRAFRFYSRILETDPATSLNAWTYTAQLSENRHRESFFSLYRGSCQRLPNGNTLITESDSGRIFEVAADGEIVWEYVNPNYIDGSNGKTNYIYRAYRVDFSWPTGDVGPGDGDFIW